MTGSLQGIHSRPGAEELREKFLRLDPADPARYDFALTRLGILGLVRARGDRIGLRHLLEVLDDAETVGREGVARS